MQREKLEILREVLGRYYQSGQEYLFKCPKCNHSKRKLSINLDKGVYKCWICDYSGLKLGKLVKRYGAYSEFQKWKDIDGSVDIASFDDLFSTKQKEQETIVSLPESFKTLTGRNKGFAARHANTYLKSRNIDREDILRWKIGFCDDGEYEGRICIPSFDNNGDLNYFIARGYGNQYPKYKNPPVSRDIIFNDLYVDWEEPIVLVEGVFDAIVAGNAVPILGSVLKESSKLFQKIVKNKSTVYVALDPDAKDKEQNIINSLLEYGINVYKIDVSQFDDVGSMTKSEFLQRKKDATIIDSIHYLYQCLEF